MSAKKPSRLAQRNTRNDEPAKEVAKSEPVKEIIKLEPVKEAIKSEPVEQKNPEQRRLADIVSPSESHFVPHEDPSISDWSQESVKPLEPINEIPTNEQSSPTETKKSVADFDRAKIATLRASIESVTGKLSYDEYLMLLIQLGEEQKNLDISLGCERLLKKINREFNDNAKKRNQFGNNNQQRKSFDKSENIGDMTTIDNSESQQSGFRGGFRGGRGNSMGGFRGGRGGSFNRGNDDGFKNDSDVPTNSTDSFKPRENHSDGGFKPRENNSDGVFKSRENHNDGSFRGRDNGFRGGRGGIRNESNNPDGNSNNGFKGSIQNETNESNNDNGFKGRGGFRNESNNGDGSGFRGRGGFRNDSNNGDGSGFRGRGGGFRNDSNNGDGSRGRGGFRGGEFKSKFNSRNDN